jgi:hypothetical protein
LFAAAAKLPTLEHGHLMRELVDLGLAVQDLAVFANDGFVTVGDLRNQITSEFAQLLCVQTGQ